MSKFDKIKGYHATKRELQQIADILKNRTAYDRLGVSVPRGLLLFGNPGVGKSLMASAVIEASERPVFICRKDKPNGDFVKEIKASFDKAIAASPSIVYLDEMDKFANGDEKHPNAEEYVMFRGSWMMLFTVLLLISIRLLHRLFIMKPVMLSFLKFFVPIV